MWVSTPSKYQPSNSSILLALLCCFPGYFSQDCSPIHDFSCCLLAQSRGFPFPTLLSEPISIESQPVCHREELPLPAEISVPQPWSHCSAWAFSERSQQTWMKKSIRLVTLLLRQLCQPLRRESHPTALLYFGFMITRREDIIASRELGSPEEESLKGCDKWQRYSREGRLGSPVAFANSVECFRLHFSFPSPEISAQGAPQ